LAAVTRHRVVVGVNATWLATTCVGAFRHRCKPCRVEKGAR